MSAERRPLSGKLIEAIQTRYTQNRIQNGTATEESTSERILQPLKQKGLIKGFSDAVNKVEEIVSAIQESEGVAPEANRTFRKFVVGTLIVMGTTEIVLIASGVNICKVGREGHWEPFVKFAEKIEKEMDEKNKNKS